MVALDTDVLLLAFAFHRDVRQAANTRFLDYVQRQAPIVAIYSVMELLGQLSFNLAPARLVQWPIWLQDRYQLTLIYPETDNLVASSLFDDELVNRPFTRMQQQPTPYLDALILGLIERVTGVETFVTWNAPHHRGKTPLTVLTPAEYINQFD